MTAGALADLRSSRVHTSVQLLRRSRLCVMSGSWCIWGSCGIENGLRGIPRRGARVQVRPAASVSLSLSLIHLCLQAAVNALPSVVWPVLVRVCVLCGVGLPVCHSSPPCCAPAADPLSLPLQRLLPAQDTLHALLRPESTRCTIRTRCSVLPPPFPASLARAEAHPRSVDAAAFHRHPAVFEPLSHSRRRRRAHEALNLRMRWDVRDVWDWAIERSLDTGACPHRLRRPLVLMTSRRRSQRQPM